MVLFGGILSIKAVTFLTFCVFLIAGLGYLLGRITIKGVSLGTAGVFIAALLFGAFFYGMDKEGNVIGGLAKQLMVGNTSYITNALKIVENLGLILFVTAVGFIAGPSFFGDLRKNFTSYIALGLLIIVIGGLACAGCIVFDIKVFGRPKEEVGAMLVGLLSGSLTSTPAFSAAKATVESSANFTAQQLEDIVAVGHGIAYLFGVIGVVLFVQLVPKFGKADMEKERAKLSAANPTVASKLTGKELVEKKVKLLVTMVHSSLETSPLQRLAAALSLLWLRDIFPKSERLPSCRRKLHSKSSVSWDLCSF